MTGTTPDWWLDEIAHAGHEHLDAAYVAGYEAKSGFDPAEDVDELRRHGLGPGTTVLDLGAGTGVFTAAVAPLARMVTAVDVSPAMAAAVRAKVDAAGLDNVTVVEAGFLSYEHEGEAVDVVYTRNALHQVPDFWKGIALARIAGWLRPGGILRLRDLAFDFDPADADDRIAAWMAGAVDDPAKGYTPEELAEHVRTEHSTYSWLLDQLLDHTGFETLTRDYRRSAYCTYTCRRRA